MAARRWWCRSVSPVQQKRWGIKQAGNATQLTVPPLQAHVATMSQMPVASLRQSAREGRKMYEDAAGRKVVEVGLLQLAAQSLANHS